MKFAKPIVAVLSVGLMSTLTACGSEPDTQNLLPNPSTTIGMEIPKPTPTDSSAPGAEISASPDGQSRTDKPIPVPEQTPSPIPANKALTPKDADLSTARALYARNLQLIEIATIAGDKSNTSEVKSITVSQIRDLKAQNSSLAKFMEKNNMILPKPGELVPNPYLTLRIEVKPSDIRALKSAREDIVNGGYYSLLRSTFRDLTDVESKLKDVLGDDAKKYLAKSLSDDAKTMAAFEAYRKEAIASGARP